MDPVCQCISCQCIYSIRVHSLNEQLGLIGFIQGNQALLSPVLKDVYGGMNWVAMGVAGVACKRSYQDVSWLDGRAHVSDVNTHTHTGLSLRVSSRIWSQGKTTSFCQPTWTSNDMFSSLTWPSCPSENGTVDAKDHPKDKRLWDAKLMLFHSSCSWKLNETDLGHVFETLGHFYWKCTVPYCTMIWNYHNLFSVVSLNLKKCCSVITAVYCKWSFASFCKFQV